MRCSVEVGEDRRGSRVEGLNVFSFDVFYRKSLLLVFLRASQLSSLDLSVVGSCGVPITEEGGREGGRGRKRLGRMALQAQGLAYNLLGQPVKLLAVFAPHLRGIHVRSTLIVRF